MDEKGLGARLQQVRREKGYTQQSLCNAANLSYSTLAKIERGAIKTPSIFTIQSIAIALGVGLDYLMGNVDLSHPSEAKRGGVTKSGVRFVYFDVNGCLVRGYQRTFTMLAELSGILPDIIETQFWHYNDDLNRGTISMSDFNEVLTRRLGVHVDWAKAYLEVIEPIEPMQQLIARTAEKYRVGLLSNSMPGLIPALREIGKLPNISYDLVIDSSEVGVIKPDEKIFEIATERAGCLPSEILLVDDTRSNLLGAEQYGWHVALFDGGMVEESVERVAAALEPAD